MGKLGRDEFYKIAGVKQHAEFERYLRDILFKPKKREEFYQKLLEIDSGFLFYLIQTKAPRHFNRVQQGLNLTIEDIETIPVAITFATRPEKYEQTQLNI